MSYFNINVADTLSSSSEMKVISNKLLRLSERLDRKNGTIIFATAGRSSFYKVETAKSNVSAIARKVGKLSGELQEISTLYQMTEDEIIQKSSINTEQIDKIINQMTEAWQLIPRLFNKEENTTLAENRINEFLAGEYLQGNNFWVSTLIEEANDLLKDGMKPIKGLQDLIGYLGQDEDFEIPIVGTFIDKIKTIDVGIGLINCFVDYVSGDVIDDTELMVEAAGKLAQNMFKIVDKAGIFGKDDFFTMGILDAKGWGLDYLGNMTKNMLEAWANGNMSIEEAYYHIFGHSALETTLDTLEDGASFVTYLIYEPISGIAECMGWNLGSVYEKHSDKKGVDAVIDCMGQVKNLILENSSFDGWVNGLQIMFGLK